MKFNLTNTGLTGNLELGTSIKSFPVKLQDITQADSALFSAEYGYDVYLNQNTLAVSDPGYIESGINSGAVFIFRRAGADWILESKIIPPELTAGSRFGESIALQGDLLIVGAPGHNSTGSVYSYVSAGGVWYQVTELMPDDLAYGDRFGNQVSLEGNTVAIGAKNHLGTGSVYIYSYINNIWMQESVHSGTEVDQNFGASLDLQGNTLIVGSPDYQGKGAVYVFNRDVTWTETNLIQPDSLQAGDGFGYSVSLDHDTFVAGSLADHAFIYKKSYSGWLLQAAITDSGGFGKSVSISADTVAIGTPDSAFAGTIHFYQRTGTVWNSVTSITGHDSSIGDQFGYSLFLLESLLVTGSPERNRSYVYAPTVPAEPPPPPVPDLSPILLEAIPNTGYYTGGQQITLNGDNFQIVDSVTFNGIPSTDVYSLNNKSIAVITPPGGIGPATIEVTTPYGSNSKDIIFTYIIPPPIINSVIPNTGFVNGGTTVNLIGEFLSETSSVTFDGVLATDITIISDTEVSVVTPEGNLGFADIEIITPYGTYLKRNSFTYTVPPPTITNITPVTGSIDGGTLLNITGLNLSTTQSIQIGDYQATGIFVASDTLVTALTPEEFSAKTVPVTITTIYGTSDQPFEFTYFVVSPVITSISPSSGTIDGGTVVTITGNYFVNVTDVKIGDNSLIDTLVVNKKRIVGTTPVGTEGIASVSVTTDYGVTAPNSLFTYFVPPPDVFSVSPNTGTVEGGTAITIEGNNLSTVQTVTVGGNPATDIVVIDDETLTAVTPAGPAGNASVVVTTDYGSNNENTLFEYYIPAPEVFSVTPDIGSYQGGTEVTISGNYFSDTSMVTFGGIPASSIIIDDETITAITPANTVGPVSVLITTPYGTNAPNSLYTYNAPAPVVSSVSPATGPTYGGTSITISGEHFINVQDVFVGESNALSVTVVDSETIAAVTPNTLSPGPVDIAVRTEFGFETGPSFEYYIPAPIVSGVSPSTGTVDGGTSISISGDYFLGTTAVSIGGNPATSFNVIDRDTLNAVTPAGVAGNASVEVTTAGGTNPPNSIYTYVIPAPVFYSVSPNTGLTTGGTEVTISGNYFTGASSVTFDGAASTFTVVDDEIITATTPVGFTGPASVVVTTGQGSNPANTAFTYYPPVPVVNTITPGSGTIDGGTSVTISGQYFTDATEVEIGGTPLSGYIVVDDNTITGVTGIKTSGSYTVTVTTPGGTNTSGAEYTYFVPAPEVYSVSPETGNFNESTEVVILGDYFIDVTDVQIGDLDTTYTVNGRTQITATTAGNSSTGIASVNVTTATGTNTPNTLFTFTLPVPNPTAVIPAQDWPDGGTTVTITGTNFYQISSITFDGVPVASFTVDSPTSITTIVPAGSIGPASVVLTNPSGSNPENNLFTYLNPYPETYTFTQSLIGPAAVSNDQFGKGVSIYGDTMVIGRPGSSYVEIFRDVGGTWVNEAVITPSDREGDESFGYSVSLYEDTLAVGAYREDTSPYSKNGAVYIFNRSGTTWTETQKIIRSSSNSQFGFKVSLYGNTLAASGINPTTSVGAVYMYANEGGVWTYKTLVSGGDTFGNSISLYDNRLAIGDWGFDSPSTNIGRVSVYTFDGTTLSIQQHIQAPTPTTNTYFGLRVSLYNNTLAVGTYEELSKGSVYVYSWNGTTWSQDQRLTGSDTTDGSSFSNVALYEDRLVVGAEYKVTDPGFNQGAAYFFGKSAITGQWQELQSILPPILENAMLFGEQVSLHGTRLAISAPSYGLTNGGAVFTYISN